MQLISIDSLNERFAIPGHLRFTLGPGGLTTATVENALCSAAVTLLGAHVISYQGKGQPDLFWMSPNSAYRIGKALRGGIPLCWPWFGPHPLDSQAFPMHGFARTQVWSVSATQALSDGSTEVRLVNHDTPETLAMWPHAFEVELMVTCGARLSVDLVVRNPGSQPFVYTGALHHYFLVSDVRQVRVTGLEDTDYLDKVENFARKHQEGAIIFTAQTDRIYLETERECVIEDPGLNRKIHIAKAGSHTTVVWNPAERAAQMPDIGLGNESSFVCVETANAAQDIVEVLPGRACHLAAQMWTEQAF